MADFFRGLQGGFQTGMQLGQAMRQRRLEEELAQEAARYTPTEGAYGAGLQENIQQVRGLQEQAIAGGMAPEEAARQYAPAIAELERRSGLTAPDYTIASGPQAYATREEAMRAAAPMRAQGLANVYRRFGDTERADVAEARALQAQQAGLQIRAGERAERKEIDFETGYADLNKQKFETPEAKTEALLSLVERTQGPQAAQQLRASYSTTELNNIQIQAQKFDNEYKQARQKGVDSALEWFDKQNASFTLERDPKNPFRVIQVNTDGSRQLFADARNERELGMAIDARAKPGGWLELAKYDLDARNTESLIAYREAAAKEAASKAGAAANALSGVQMGYARGADGQLVPVLSGIRFNKRTGDAETVQVPLDRRVIPADAMDPAKIAKQAEELVGTPIDPTNKKGPVHTTQSARQAVTDQIVNQYLGTGGPAAGPDLSPQGLAQRIKNQAAPAAKQEQPAPAPRQPATVGIDTGRLSTNINPVTGLPRETPVQAPNLVAAASRGLSAAESNYKAYLQGKLDRNEKLTVDEQMRARRFGLQ